MISAMSISSVITRRSPVQGLARHRVGWSLGVVPNSKTFQADFFSVDVVFQEFDVGMKNIFTPINHPGSRLAAECRAGHEAIDRQVSHDHSPSAAASY